jgi:hypothetical protein
MHQVLRQGDLLNTNSKRGENNLKVGRKTRRSSTHVSKRQAKNSMEIYKRQGGCDRGGRNFHKTPELVVIMMNFLKPGTEVI